MSTTPLGTRSITTPPGVVSRPLVQPPRTATPLGNRMVNIPMAPQPRPQPPASSPEHAATMHWHPVGSAQGYKRESHISLARAFVPGGWLVRMFSFHPGGQESAALTFLPDPQHAWDGNADAELPASGSRDGSSRES